MNYQSVNIVNCLNSKLCEISDNYVNSTMYGLCNINLNEIKEMLLIKFLINSECKSYNVKCLLEKINCP